MTITEITYSVSFKNCLIQMWTNVKTVCIDVTFTLTVPILRARIYVDANQAILEMGLSARKVSASKVT